MIRKHIIQPLFSDSRQCLGDVNCSALTRFYISQICPSGVDLYCSEEAALIAYFCKADVMSTHGKNCRQDNDIFLLHRQNYKTANLHIWHRVDNNKHVTSLNANIFCLSDICEVNPPVTGHSWEQIFVQCAKAPSTKENVFEDTVCKPLNVGFMQNEVINLYRVHFFGNCFHVKPGLKISQICFS